jgi:hypothetical protein
MDRTRRRRGPQRSRKILAPSRFLYPVRASTTGFARSSETKRNHQGPPPDWRDRFVSAYASAHPWEDWAETWAHYLHIADTWDTALSFGLDVDDGLEFEDFTHHALARPDDPESRTFLQFLNRWTQLTAVLNELSRAMGLPDFYPFILSQRAVAKLHFVHAAIQGPHRN